MTKELFWTRLDKSMAAEYAAWKLLNEEEEISDEEFWKKVNEHWKNLDEKVRRRSKKTKLDRLSLIGTWEP